jgi:hypothetical protein
MAQFGLPDLNTGLMLGVVAFDRRRVGTALVDGNLPSGQRARGCSGNITPNGTHRRFHHDA